MTFEIPTVVRHIFEACPVWIYTQSNITSIIPLLFFLQSYYEDISLILYIYYIPGIYLLLYLLNACMCPWFIRITFMMFNPMYLL
jgi:hypothetical protein